MQGQDVDDGIAVDTRGLSNVVASNMMWTALTRCSGDVYVVLDEKFLPGSTNTTTKRLGSWGQCSIMTALLALAAFKPWTSNAPVFVTAADDPYGLVRLALRSHLRRSLSPAAATQIGVPAAPSRLLAGDTSAYPEYEHLTTAQTQRAIDRPRELRQGSTLGVFDRREMADFPDRRTFVAHELRFAFPVTADSVVTTSNPPEEYPEMPEMMAADFTLERSDYSDGSRREARVKGIAVASHQFPEGGAIEAPHHRASDPTTEKMGHAKRLRIGTPHVPSWCYLSARAIDPALYAKSLPRASLVRLQQLRRGFSKFFEIPDQPLAFSEAGWQEAGRLALSSWAGGRTKGHSAVHATGRR
jgi:hypothetical protein